MFLRSEPSLVILPMKTNVRTLSIFVALSISTLSADDTLVRTSDPLSPAEEHAVLKVAEGFEIQLFASEPQINKPINLAYDSKGRLWVSSTVEYPYAANKERWVDPIGTRVNGSRDAIKILEDTDGDGRADKVTDFADGLNIPTGVLPWHRPDHKDGCIAWSIPNIWYFADTTGDGKADHREVLFGPLGYEKDTHGMCSSFRMGPDGWVYATHGFNNTSTLKGKDGSEVTLHSGNVFRFKPDASRVEVYTRGQVNPFGLCFDQRGNLYSADCHSSPVYQLLRGGVYPSFGKPHDGLGFAPTMIEHTHGSTGICGITYVDRNQWGADWNDHLLIGNPVTSKINHDKIEFRGTTPVAVEQPDFVSSKDPWFRPVDLCHGDDGAVYVADFYNRIIGHYEVPLDHKGRDRERGRIWKITRTGKTSAPTKLPPIRPIDILSEALAEEDPFIQRQAAQQLQFSPEPKALLHLLDALTKTPAEDTHLRHVLRMAIRECLKTPGALDSFIRDRGTPPDTPFVKQEHLDELTAIAPAVPTAESAALLANSPKVAENLRHISRHGTAEVLNRAIAKLVGKGGQATEVARIDSIQAGLDERGASEPNAALLDWAQDLAIQLLERKDGDNPAVWIGLPHPKNPRSESPWTQQERECSDGKTATVISSLRIGEGSVEQRTGILQSKAFPAPETLTFWIVGHRGSPKEDPHEKNYVSLVNAAGEELQRAYPPRSDVATKISWKFQPDQVGKPVHLRLTDGDAGSAYTWLGIARISGAAPQAESFRRADDADASLAKLAELLKLTAPVSLRDRLAPYLPKSEVAAKIAISAAERERLQQLIEARVASYQKAKVEGALNPEAGAEVYRANCAACHQIGGAGGLIGPQLDGIGTRGIERLAEDILDPNRNVDSHFFLTKFKLKNGTERNAFLISERGESLQLRDLAGKAQRLPKSAVAATETIPASFMPSAFGSTLSETDFHNLLAWLADEQ